MSLNFMCKNCGRSFIRYNSLQKLCGLCQYNKQMKPTKPLKRMGPVTRKWYETRGAWLQQNASPTNTWKCFYCGTLLTVDTLTLDHYHSRSRRPDLRFDLSNLVPSCWDCNLKKGSKSGEEYLASLK